jgi:hypothetical protein
MINMAYYFDGINDVITTSQAYFANNNQLSVSLWVRAPGSVSTHYYIMCSDFGVFQSGAEVGLAISLPSTNNAAGAITFGQWYHLAGTYDGNTIRAYINGSLSEETHWPGNISDPNRVLTFGLFNNQFWQGTLDEVRIYNRVLTAAEIRQLYDLASSSN